MNDLLSTVSGQFGKTLIFGTLLPVIVFCVLVWAFVGPMLPADLESVAAFSKLSPEWKLAVASFTTLILTGLLLSLNIPLIRLYEGYPWKGSWIGSWCVRRGKARFAALHARWAGLRTLLYVENPPPVFNEQRRTVTNLWRDIGQEVNTEFPAQKHLVLPTRLGNVIRSFESYPETHYSMDSIALWPRLVGVIEKEYAAAVDEAKASFDFMLNSAALSAVLSAAILITRLIFPVPLALPGQLVQWLLQVTSFAGLSYTFYFLAVPRAAAWGEMVKGAFDLYRGNLLRKLGYGSTPITLAEEREIWNILSLQVLYSDSPRARVPPFTSPTCSAKGKPAYIELQVVRGVTRTADPRELIINLRIENTGTPARTARSVVVTDTIPDQYDYLWNSAALGPRPVSVIGTNPLTFAIGDLPHGSPVELTYRILGRKSS